MFLFLIFDVCAQYAFNMVSNFNMLIIIYFLCKHYRGLKFTFSWIELQMLLRCCLIHIAITILRHILSWVYLCPCLACFHCHWHTWFFLHFLEYLLSILDDNMDDESEWFSNSKTSSSGCCLAWFFANVSLALLIKVLLRKKSMYVVFIK